MAERARATTTQAIRQPRPISAKQRGDKATESLRQTLDLPAVTGDSNVLTTALAEVASEESTRNPSFAEALRARYRDLMAQQPAPRGAGSKAELPPLVPIRRIDGYRANPFAPPDPQFLIQLYGSHQLNRALQDYTLDMLKETATRVQADHPGTKPRSKASKQSVIDYIVQYSGTVD